LLARPRCHENERKRGTLVAQQPMQPQLIE
jgi:hypothetical protein